MPEDIIAAAGDAATDPLTQQLIDQLRRETTMSGWPLLDQITQKNLEVIGPSPTDVSTSATSYVKAAIAAAPSVPYQDVAIWAYVSAAVLALGFIILLIARARCGRTAYEKITESAISLAWGAFFASALYGLGLLGTSNMLTGTATFYVGTIAALAGSGLIVLISRLREVARLAREDALSAVAASQARPYPPAGTIPPQALDAQQQQQSQAQQSQPQQHPYQQQPQADIPPQIPPSPRRAGRVVTHIALDATSPGEIRPASTVPSQGFPDDERYLSVLDDDDDALAGASGRKRRNRRNSRDHRFAQEMRTRSLSDLPDAPDAPDVPADSTDGDHTPSARNEHSAQDHQQGQQRPQHVPPPLPPEMEAEAAPAAPIHATYARARTRRRSRLLWRLSTSTLSRIVAYCLLSAALIFASAATSVLALELPANSEGLFKIGDPYLYAEFLVLLGTTCGAWLIFQRKGISLCIVPIICLVYGTAEYFVETFKKAAIMPSDLMSASTGFAVAGNYEYDVTSSIMGAALVACLLIAVASCGKDPLSPIFSRLRDGLPIFAHKVSASTSAGPLFPTPDAAARYFSSDGTRRRIRSVSRRRIAGRIMAPIVSIASVAAGVAIVCSTWQGAYATDWQEDAGVELDNYITTNSFHQFGIIPSFLDALQIQDLKPPSGYDGGEAQELQSSFAETYDALVGSGEARQAAETQFEEIQPNVVCIMNESFADLSFLNGLNADYPGPGVFQQSQAYAKGKLAVSIYGGGTCNTEFEMLTETPLAYVGGGIYPYVMYDMEDVNSAVETFSDIGYDTTAMHPELATNWKRSSIYPDLGFDEFLSIEDFDPAATRHRGMVADMETYKVVLDILRTSDEPQFIWDLTMANHGGYGLGALPAEETIYYPFENWVDPSIADMTREYVSSIAMSDAEVGQFLVELQTIDEPTVVVFFGDHQPGFTSAYTETIYWDHPELEKRELSYLSDYAIWANYEIAGWDGICYDQTMSAGQLMSYAKSLMGAPMTDYEKAQYVSRLWTPAANIFGYLDELVTWHDIAEMKQVSGTYDKAMELLATTREVGGILMMDPADPVTIEEKLRQDRVILSAMSWVSYLNFQAKVL